jgi:collagenase-like PrtC family protease
MIHLNLGYNFDTELPDKLNALNQKYGVEGYKINKITGVYGSDKAHAWLSARPDFRLPEVSKFELRTHVHRLLDKDIEFNYTINTSYPGSKESFAPRVGEFVDWIGTLANMGVKRLIVANPMFIDILSKKAPEIDIAIELSTIMHIDTPMQMQAFKQLDKRVDKVVSNLLYNRDFSKLATLAGYAKDLSLGYEVMVNEFCATGSYNNDVPVGTHCIFRDSCYNCHAENETVEHAKLLNNYPMGDCMSSRAHDIADWLRSPFIRPEDTHFYENIGIQHFKVTGRTAKTPYILHIAEAYLSGKFDGNMLQLWKPLETIYSDKDELSGHKHKHNIPNAQLEGFISPFVKGEINCNNTTCEECFWCDEVASGLE